MQEPTRLLLAVTVIAGGSGRNVAAMVKTLRAVQWPVDQISCVDYTSVMPRRFEALPDPMEKLAQEVLCLSREVLVLRETLDEIREYLQWISRTDSRGCPLHGR